MSFIFFFFFFSSRRRHTRSLRDWSSDVCSSDLASTHQVKHTSAIGTRYDSADSASVQVFLAALPQGEVLRLFDRRVLTGAHDPESVAEYQQILERSEEHTSELQSRRDLVCRLLL